MPDSVFETAYRASKRSYERGRLLTALRRAAIAVVVVAGLGGLALGRNALVWLPVTFAVVTLTEWYGAAVMRAARRGFLVGLASLLLPLSLLRPCCKMDAKALGMSCCTMPSACWAVGAVVGLAMALALPKVPEGHARRAGIGMMLGVASVAVLRCSMLFLGEAFGLVGGIVAGAFGMSLAHSALRRRGA